MVRERCGGFGIVKRCLTCKKLLTLDNFTKNNKTKDKLAYHCRTCRNKKEKIVWKKHYAKHKDRINKRKRELHKKESYKIRDREYKLKYNYNISIEQYENLHNNQHHKCLICNRKEVLFVDHDHKTGKVRGLLCSFCNMLLGYLEKHNINSKNIDDYLKHNKGV